MSKKALLIICDGWGIGDKGKDDVIFNTPTPYWDELLKTYPASQLQASGENVGLPDGQMGNSEVGHLNIGAGRIVYQDLVKINIACRENTIMENPEIKRAYSYAKENNKQIHFMGLVSDGGVHSSLEHLMKLTDIAKEYGISKAYVHCFMDGRDTDPKSGKGFIEMLENHLKTTGGKIASIIGRYYAKGFAVIFIHRSDEFRSLTIFQCKPSVRSGHSRIYILIVDVIEIVSCI